MSHPFSTRRPGHLLALALWLAATATGCGLLPVEPDGDPPPATEPSASAPSPADTTAESPPPQADPEPNATPEAPAEPDEPQAPAEGLYIARSDRAEEERRATLREEGHETLDPDRLGYYMDVLGARLRQELAGQPATIEHRDSGIRVTLPEGTGQDRALDTIGRLLDEFRASLVTVIAVRPTVESAGEQAGTAEADALSAGRRLEGAGVAPARLVLRVLPAGTAPGSAIFAPEIELLIQPLATS
ncbi:MULTISPECIES: hypothetical protein [unclassified Thioalkalivibrio]|uniref:hypothetical protein n=1 Tax=unclassified Thioalkalivibrio TaxID=2621013 RepID=UPI000476076F|nr:MULTISPECIES: hypothetical protein [unclassified Thioalkalivibrio]